MVVTVVVEEEVVIEVEEGEATADAAEVDMVGEVVEVEEEEGVGEAAVEVAVVDGAEDVVAEHDSDCECT